MAVKFVEEGVRGLPGRGIHSRSWYVLLSSSVLLLPPLLLPLLRISTISSSVYLPMLCYTSASHRSSSNGRCGCVVDSVCTFASTRRGIWYRNGHFSFEGQFRTLKALEFSLCKVTAAICLECHRTLQKHSIALWYGCSVKSESSGISGEWVFSVEPDATRSPITNKPVNSSSMTCPT